LIYSGALPEKQMNVQEIADGLADALKRLKKAFEAVTGTIYSDLSTPRARAVRAVDPSASHGRANESDRQPPTLATRPTSIPNQKTDKWS
jgi:hypothetical protein